MDLVDEILADWSKQRPDIDCGGKLIVCRILRFYSQYISALEKSLKPLRMAPNVFSVLVTIRRKGKTSEVSVKNIIQEVLITSGAMSNLLTRLIDTGLVKKRPDDNDARSMLIKLTPKGLKLVDKAMEIQAACERKLTHSLDRAEKKHLATLLKKIQPRNFNMLSVEKNITLIERYFEDVWNQGKLEVLDEIISTDYINHSPGMPNPPRGPEGLKPIVAAIRDAFPDLKYVIENMVISDDQVAVHTTMHGTHQGDFFGLAPTGKTIKVAQMQIERIENGKMVEHWRVTDDLNLMRQLGQLKE